MCVIFACILTIYYYFIFFPSLQIKMLINFELELKTEDEFRFYDDSACVGRVHSLHKNVSHQLLACNKRLFTLKVTNFKKKCLSQSVCHSEKGDRWGHTLRRQKRFTSVGSQDSFFVIAGDRLSWRLLLRKSTQTHPEDVSWGRKRNTTKNELWVVFTLHLMNVVCQTRVEKAFGKWKYVWDSK